MSVAGPWEPDKTKPDEAEGSTASTSEQQQAQAGTSPPSKASLARYDVDPADPRRRVVHKKINTPYLRHQRWKEAQRQAEADALVTSTSMAASADAASSARRRPAAASTRPTTTANGAASSTGKGKGKEQKPRSWAFLVGKWLLVTLLVAIGAGQFIAGDVLWGYRGRYTKIETYVPPTRVFTPQELWQYNGQDKDKPVLLSILGNVYDVTPGRWIYGPRGTYRFFAGRDASRAYVTGCFETHLTHDLRGLTETEIQGIESWKSFYDDHGAYRWLGKLDLPPIDPKSPIPAPCRDEDNADRPDDAQKPVT